MTDKPIDLYGPCAWCGGSYAALGPVCVESCSEGYEYLRASQWPITLGHAIARFVRRAEVEGLVETVRDESQRYADALADHLPATRRLAEEQFNTALTRLAALALGGGS